MSYKFEVKEQNLQPTLSIRITTSVKDLPQALGKGYGQIGQYMAELGEPFIGAPFAAYYNMDMDNLDVEMGFPVSKKLADKGKIKAGKISAGKIATYTYTGPYDKIEPAYDAMSKWMAENGHTPTGVVYEFYLNDPAETPPEELKTKIVFPLKK